MHESGDVWRTLEVDFLWEDHPTEEGQGRSHLTEEGQGPSHHTEEGQGRS